MPATSKAQQKFMGMVHGLQKGTVKPSGASAKVKKVADSMSDKDAEDFASTKHKKLPNKVKKEIIAKLRELVRIELEGTCGYAPDGKLDVHNTDKLTPAGPHLLKKKKKNESVNEGFTKYHIRLTKTPGWYGVWDKNGKQKFEGDRKFVMKHLKKLKTRMGNYQLKSLIDVATKRKGKDIEFDVVESVVKEAGMGILDSDQSDILQGIVLRNKNKSLKSILSVALKSGYFKGVDKKELLGYIDGAKQFVKYMKSHPMESVDEERDYKAEYKKYGSSTKAKKYRAELNQYNRKKGTYGNGDGKDASHKGGKIVGFEKESTNRGRAEKSRLKKEAISKEEWAQYPKYARKLKPYLQKLFKVPIKVRVIKQANHNPWIDVRVARFGKDIIPNDFRKKAAKVIGASGVRDWDNVNYGNIRVNSISLKADDWKKLLGNKVKSESVNEIMAGSQIPKTPTKKLVKIYKQMADERLSSGAALIFRMIAKELIKRKAKLEGGKDCCGNCKEGKECCSEESVNEGKKRFKVGFNIGKAKYVISHHDGREKHKDGSDFFGISIYKNKKAFEKGQEDLRKKGYIEESVNEVKLIKITKSQLREIIREEIQKLNEGFGSPELMDEKDLAKFEKTRQKNAEVLGYKLTGRPDHKPMKEKIKVTSNK
jgi:hypothetical protein